MNTEQKKVAIGAATGVLSMILLVAMLFLILPSPAGMDATFARVIFTLRMNVLAIIPLLAGLVVVGNNRFLSAAIDPLRHAEDRVTTINSRFAGNTLQQNFVFFVGTMALSTFLDAQSIKLILALTIVFIVARIVFWVGYRIDPLYRAPGMAATAYMNLGIILAVTYLVVS